MIKFLLNFLNNARISKRHLSLEIKSENSPGVVPVNQVVGVARILVKLPHRVVTESSHSKHLVLRLSEQLAETRQDRMQLHGGKDGWLVQVPGTEVDVDDQLLCRASWGSLCPRNRPQYFHTHDHGGLPGSVYSSFCPPRSCHPYLMSSLFTSRPQWRSKELFMFSSSKSPFSKQTFFSLCSSDFQIAKCLRYSLPLSFLFSWADLPPLISNEFCHEIVVWI